MKIDKKMQVKNNLDVKIQQYMKRKKEETSALKKLLEALEKAKESGNSDRNS